MSVTIKRNTGFLGRGLRVTVKLNREKIAKIGYGETITVELPADSAHLEVSQSGSKSNALDVSDEDTIEITTTKWSYLIYFLIALSPILLKSVTDSFIFAIIIVLMLVTISVYLVEGFNLTVLNRKSREN